MWQVVTNWDKAIDDIRITNWARRFIDYWHADNQNKGLAHDFLYAGDSGEFQDVYASFPAASLKRMNAVRKAYDPQSVFTRLHWGGFKIVEV